MQHTDSVDAPLMHAALGRWPALNADTGDTEITGWTACAEKINGRWYTCWGFNGRAQSWERLADCPDCGTSLIEPWPLRTCCAKYHSDVPRLKAIFTHRRRRPFSSGSIGWTVHAEEWHGWPYARWDWNGAPQHWQAITHCTCCGESLAISSQRRCCVKFFPSKYPCVPCAPKPLINYEGGMQSDVA